MDEIIETPEGLVIRYVTYLENGALDGCYLQVPPEEHVSRMIVVDDAADQAFIFGHGEPR